MTNPVLIAPSLLSADFSRLDEDIRGLCVDRASATVIKRTALQKGLVSLRGDGIRKVKLGQSTIQEVLRVTQMDIE